MKTFSFPSILLIPLLTGTSYATCPGETPCSGHGICGAYDICGCFPNWQGFDCSERKCQYGAAWDASVTTYLECSGKGDCDRETGLCTCYEGYEGVSCNRT